MRLSKKQQAIVDILHTQGILDKHVLFERLEGVIEDKKVYRSRYNSFTQTVKKLVEKGALEWREEALTVASETTQETVKKTQEILEVLTQLREAQQTLTFAHLNQWTNIRDWVGGFAEWQLSLPLTEKRRLIDLDMVLDDAPDLMEPILHRLGVDPDKILSAGLIFSTLHQQQLQRELHTRLCERIRQFSIPHKTLKTTIEAKLTHQSSQKTISELLEQVVAFTQEDEQQIINGFPEPYLKQAASRRLTLLFQSQIPFKPQLKLRFPGFFVGSWDWDRLYQQLVQKITDHAKAHGLYQTPEAWQRFLKQQARHRFQQAQQPQTRADTQPPPRQKTVSLPPLYSCYQLLGLEETENIDEIRMAFRKLVKVHHPDQGGNPEFFRSLNQAYTRLITSLENR